MISIYGRKSNKHKWNLLGRTSFRNQDFINIVYSIYRDDNTFLVGYTDSDISPDSYPKNYKYMHILSVIDYETACKMVDFINTGILSINPPLFAKLVTYGLLQY